MENKIDIISLVCPHILNMKAYSSARMEYDGKEGVFLDANENSLGSVSDELHNRYPDPLQSELKESISKIEPVQSNQLFLGNGSDECINVLIQCFCQSGKDSVMILPPTFSMYEHASKVMNIQILEVLLSEETFQLNVQDMLLTIQQHPELKIIFICSPNNPTANLINADDIEIILHNFNGLVVIDEAYQDFSGNNSWVNRLKDFRNLVVIKTFSKAWGMADARLGMLFADEEIIHYLNVIKMPYNVTQHTINIVNLALQRKDRKDEMVKILIESRKWLETEMQNLPFIQKIYPSNTNFILFKVENADNLYQYLLKHQLIIRNRDKAPLLKGCLRVSVGTKEENERFIEVLKNYKA